jgi:hypothetical protein
VPPLAARPWFSGTQGSSFVSATTIPLPNGGWQVRLPLSVTASVIIHALLIAGAALLLRAMPATIVSERGSIPLSATILALPPLRLEPAAPLPPLTPVEPMLSMLAAPIAPPSRSTPLPGVSATPAKIQVQAEFIPVGRISYGVGNGKRLLGEQLAAQLASRYPTPPARTPRLDGSLSMLYPLKGAIKGQSLALSALLMIDECGKISEARVLPEDSVFVAAVLAALKNAAFYPAQIDGKPIPYWTVLDFSFKIDGPTGPDGKRLDR